MSNQNPSFIRALRAANPALWPARAHLASLKARYKAGSYSGHPEEMLEAIEGAERLIRNRIQGARPVKASPPRVPPKTASPARSAGKAPSPLHRPMEQREDELTARSDTRGGPFEPGLEAAERRLESMRDLYARGDFMGHPEEMLEDIEAEERRVSRLKAETAAI